MFVSIVSPVYNAQNIIKELIQRITQEITQITSDYEIILVDDGSADDSWKMIEKHINDHPNVIGLKFSKNFGQHFAITAGLNRAKGDVVIVMDCDLQDNPSYFKDFIREYNNGADIVYTAKKKREHSLFKNVTAFFFNLLFNYLIDNKSWKAQANIGNYTLISRKVVDAYNKMNDSQRHYLMILRWLGFSSTVIDIEQSKRFEGRSSYTFKKLFHHAISGITSQSDKLLRISISIGLSMTFISFLAIVIVIILYFHQGFLSGWTSLFVLLLFSTGMILTSIGIAGIYIGKIFDQVKNRPLYLISNEIKSDNNH
jgi:glycosyltransferase involved in cell wall biosynthesis